MSGIRNLEDLNLIESAGFPKDLPNSTYEMIRQGAQINPNARALSFFLNTDSHRSPEVWTYDKLFSSITQTANFFYELGIEKGDVVAFVLPNLPETHLTIWGGQAAGIVCAVNPLLEPAAMAEILNAAKAKVLVTLAPFPGTDLWPKLQSVLNQIGSLRHVVLVSLASKVRGIKSLIAKLMQRREIKRLHGTTGLRGAIPKHLGLHDFSSSIQKQNKAKLVSNRSIQPDDLSSYFCTGGTTGTPKIAMRKHRNEVANAWSASQFLGDSMNATKNLFCGLPLFHVNGVLVTGLIPFSKGAHVVLGTPQGYRGEGIIPRFWEIVERHHINFFSGVPTLYAALLQIPIGSRNIHSLEFGLCGAAPLPLETMRAFQSSTGLKILEGYGLTEGTCVSSINPPFGEQRTGSIGLRIPGQKMKAVLLNEDGGYLRDCSIDEVGLILISGPNIFAGYKVEQHNKGLWCDLGDGERWLNTGDLGKQDEYGFFYLTGRKKELIIRGGHNIDPQLIEEPLHRHPAVQLAAAIGRPDIHAGELPICYVQLRQGSAATTEELMEFAQQTILERAAVPKAIHIIEQMPLTSVGKIFKPELKSREIHSAISVAMVSAKVAVEKLEVINSNSGVLLEILLKDQNSRESANKILGQFPFRFEFIKT